MRGARELAADVEFDVGIIPAYAGSTGQDRVNQSVSQDHPRVCGEHRIRDDVALGGKGSSPRMRGALELTNREEWLTRIIPAYAGSTRL